MNRRIGATKAKEVDLDGLPTCYAQTSSQDNRVKLPYLSARTSRKARCNTLLHPLRWNHWSPAVAWKVASPHPNQTSCVPYL